MRSAVINPILLALILVVATPGLQACGLEGAIQSTSIPIPGTVQSGVVRNHYFLCQDLSNHLLVVDLLNRKVFDLGVAGDRRCFDGDVADGTALLLVRDRLMVVALENGKTIQEIALGRAPVWAYGYAGQGRAFVQRGRFVELYDLATAKKLHTVALGKEDGDRGRTTPWQKVGNRLYIPGPDTTLCVIDVDAGKLTDTFAVDARAGIADMHVEGSLVYCVGSPFSWGARIDHLICFDMDAKKSYFVELPRPVRRSSRLASFASGSYGTIYLIDGQQMDRFTMHGDRCGTFTTPGGEPILAVWQQHALIAGKNEVRIMEIRETPVTRK